jgi:NAD(P)-dependent dehydrogenase (short-subunit alcohol dehydrogenase family)
MDYGLKGKVAVVTGTASQVGMGKAICVTLAKEGCDIVATDINTEGAEKTAAEVRATGRKCLVLKVDVTNRADVANMVKAAIKEFGKIDILVNNAGGTVFTGPLAEAKFGEIDKEIKLNLFGVMNCVKAVLPGMIERKYGKILNVSSTAGRYGVPGGSGYSAAKDAVIGLTKAVAREVGPSNININAIAPGQVLTNFYGGEGMPMMPPAMRERAKMVAMRRITSVQDIANLVAFYVSDVSQNIQGQTTVIDGGNYMI